MWARTSEIFFATWLSISWLIFGYSNSLLIYHDFIVAALIATFSLLSYKYRYIHLFNLIIACWLIFLVFYSQTPITNAPYQNYMVIGLLLLLFTVVPSHATEPPPGWKEFLERKNSK